jgi:hypothetical protein
LKVVIFSIAQTLGALTLAGGNVDQARLEPYLKTPALLEQLQAEGVSIRVEAPNGFSKQATERILSESGLLPFLTPALIEVSPFVGVPPGDRAVYVARDRGLRRRAGARFRTVPHPSLVRAALTDEPIFYIRAYPRGADVRFDWSQAVAGLALAPLTVAAEEGIPVLYAVASASAATTLAGHAEIVRLGAPNLPEKTDLAIFQLRFDSDAGRKFRARLEQQPVFLATPNGAIVALDQAADAEGLHPPPSEAGHGHTRALLSSEGALGVGTTTSATGAKELSEPARNLLETIDATKLGKQRDMAFGGNVTGCDGAVAIESRFLYHPHNAVAVQAIRCELKRILGNDYAHPFPYGQCWFDNAYADLQGETTELVVIGAHLDSMAAREVCGAPEVGCAATSCVAPGIDDDASGVAAVLAIASVFRSMSDQLGKPKRTVRFALFNAEEQLMIGSDAYAQDLAGTGAQVAAMFQLDMIGTPDLAPTPTPSSGTAPLLPFEFHTAGTADLSNKKYLQLDGAHQELRAAVEHAVQVLSPTLALQVYPWTGCPTDPAAAISDHMRFHAAGFPAALVIEDYFTDDCGTRRSHPTYHTSSDTSLDPAYAAAIARAVAGAAWLTANP